MSHMRHKRKETPMTKPIYCLSSCYLFQGMTEEDVSRALLLLSPTRHSFASGEIILNTDDTHHRLYFIESGSVRISRTVDGNPVLLNVAKAGDCFGVASLFGNCEKYPTIVTAKGVTSLQIVEEDALAACFASFPQTALAHIRFLSEKIRFLNDKLDSLSGRSSISKLAKFLTTNADTETGVVSSPLSMKQIASSLDIGRASLYRLLGQMESSQWILLTDGCIKICDRQSLERLANPL